MVTWFPTKTPRQSNGKEESFQQAVLGQMVSYMQKKEGGALPHITCKN